MTYDLLYDCSKRLHVAGNVDGFQINEMKSITTMIVFFMKGQ